MSIPLDRALEYREQKFTPTEIRALLFSVSQFEIDQKDFPSIAEAMWLKKLKTATLACRDRLFQQKVDR